MVMNKTARDQGASRIVRSAERVFPEHASKALGRGRLEERARKKEALGLSSDYEHMENPSWMKTITSYYYFIQRLGNP
jgi:hypothetical protein